MLLCVVLLRSKYNSYFRSMEYKNITVQVDSLSDSQKSDLELAERLLSNINSVRGVEHNIVKLNYSDDKFSITQTGYQHTFLIRDIQFAIKGNFQNHKEFILDTFQSQVDDYLQSDNSINKKHLLNSESESLFKYYGIGSNLNYPKYLDEPMLLKTLENVKDTITELLK